MNDTGEIWGKIWNIYTESFTLLSNVIPSPRGMLTLNPAMEDTAASARQERAFNPRACGSARSWVCPTLSPVAHSCRILCFPGRGLGRQVRGAGAQSPALDCIVADSVYIIYIHPAVLLLPSMPSPPIGAICVCKRMTRIHWYQNRRDQLCEGILEKYQLSGFSAW